MTHLIYVNVKKKKRQDFDQGKKIVKMSRESPYREIHVIF